MKRTRRFQNNFSNFFIKEKNKKLKILVSIPRSNSTIIEFILGLSPSVSKIIHEPFLDFGYYNDDINSAYQKISSVIDFGNKKNRVFLIKEMVHWLTKKKAYQIFFKFIDEPVILLIKNPYLSIESKIKKILQGANRKNRVSLGQYLLPFMAQGMAQGKNKNIQDSKGALNFFAQKKGYNNWLELVEKEAIQNRNFVIFTPVIKYFIENSSEDIWGWKSMDEIKKFLDKNKIKYNILEGIDFQLASEAAIRGLCEVLDINFTKKMLYYSEKKFTQLINQVPSHSILWHDKVLSSPKILKPNIPPLSADKFPLCIQTYLLNTALPLYKQLCSNQNRLNVLNYSRNLKRDRALFRNYKAIDQVYFITNKHMNYF